MLVATLSASSGFGQSSRANAPPPIASPPLAPHVAGQLLVRYRSASSAGTGSSAPGLASARPSSLSATDKRLGLLGRRAIAFDRRPAASRPPLQRPLRPTAALAQSLEVLEFPAGADLDAASKAYRADPNVVSVEPDYTFRLSLIPNDAFYAASQAADFALAGFPAAWDVATGQPGVLAAVLDQGVDTHHPELAGALDLAHGFNFLTQTADVDDSIRSHGTLVASIIGAAGNNGAGMAGGAYGVKILPLVVAAPDGSVATSDVIAALDYAVAQGAAVVNMSFSGSAQSATLAAAIAAAKSQTVIVAAVGNDAENQSARYPAAYPGVIGAAAAAKGSKSQRATFSNYNGPNTTMAAIAAPGESIFGAAPGGGFTIESGTSFAAPLVSAAAALLKSAHPEQSAQAIAAHLEARADPAGKIFTTYGFLDAAAALAAPMTPLIQISKVTVDDSKGLNAGNDGDGVLDRGETAHVIVALTSAGGDAVNTTVSLTTAIPNDPNLNSGSLSGAAASFGTVGYGATADNSTAPFGDAIVVGTGAGLINFKLTVWSEGFLIGNFPFSLPVQDEESIADGTNQFAPLHWTADKTYVVEGKLNVFSGIAIDTGTTVLMKPNASIDLLGGQIIANGTADHPIQFLPYQIQQHVSQPWGTIQGDAGDDRGMGVASAPDGSIYVAEYGLYSLEKYGSDGTLLWSRAFGGNSEAVRVCSNGDVVVCGEYGGAIILGQGEAHQTTLSGGNSFLARFAADGSLAWARTIVGSSSRALAVDKDGNICLTTPQAVAKYDANGNSLWSKSLSGSSARNEGIACLPDGSILMCGYFLNGGTIVFGQGESAETALTDADNSEGGYIAKYQADGSLLWAKQTPYNNYALDAFANGEFAVAGETNSAPVVSRYLSDGFVDWINVLAGSFDSGSPANFIGVLALPDGSVAASGCFSGTLPLQPGVPGGATLSGSGQVLVIKCSKQGMVVWGHSDGSNDPGFQSHSQSQGLCIASDSSIVMTGGYDGQLIMKADESNQTIFDRQTMGRDMYLEKLFPSPDGWNNLTVEPTASGGSMTHCIVSGGAVILEADVAVDQCAFSHSPRAGLVSTSGISPITNCTFANCLGVGVNAGGRTIISAIAQLNQTGIVTSGPVLSSSALNNRADGIQGDMVTSCTAQNNGGAGIRASGGVLASIAQANAGNGIVVAAGDLTACTAKDNALAGIALAGGTAAGCTVQGNGAGGIVTSGATVDSCDVENNTGVGITGSGNSLVSNCRVLNNTGTALSGVQSVVSTAIASNGSGIGGASSVQGSYVAGNLGAGVTGGATTASSIIGNAGIGVANPASVTDSWIVANSGAGVASNNSGTVSFSSILFNSGGGASGLSAAGMNNSNIQDNIGFAISDSQTRSGFQTKNFENNYWGPALTAWMNINPFPADRDPEIVDGFDGAAGWFLDYSPDAASPVANAPDSAPPAFLLAVSPTVANPVGRGKAVFTLTFSKAMNTGIDPAVTFDLAPPFTRQIVSPDPGWTNSTTWVGGIWIDTDTGDGTNHLRVSGATAGDGFEIPADTLHAFAIDTSGHVVANNGIGTLSLYVNGDNEIDLSWTNNSSADLQSLDKRGAQLKGGFHLASANGFRVLRSLTKDGGFRQLNADLVENPSGLNDAEYFDTELAPGTTYYYRIDFQQLSGDSLEWTDVTSATTTGVMPPPAGALQTAINPQAAIAAGAQWRRVGASTWLDSAAIEDGIPTGDVAVEFKPVAGWIAPSNQSITINDGQTALVQGTYAIQPPPPPGSLQTAIAPQAAIDAGAQWRRTGTLTWLNSGAVESGLPAGPAAVEFKSIAGWVKPPAQPTTIISGQTTQLPATYFVRSAVEPRDWALYP